MLPCLRAGVKGLVRRAPLLREVLSAGMSTSAGDDMVFLVSADQLK